ncbi:MAG: hypothetical protein ACFFDQ_10825, partial [Candidatus Thorarchaeota archaeon]
NTQKTEMETLNVTVKQTIAGVTNLTTDAVDTLGAVLSASEKLLDASMDRTWYISGIEEVCAHIGDMANRAVDSVVVSVHDLSCLDLKKLARIKIPKRKVLIIPETEETDSALEVLDGWRIMQTRTPMLLSVIDDREILVGGTTASETQIAIVSEDATYLKLYHDVLGPRLIHRSPTSEI